MQGKLWLKLDTLNQWQKRERLQCFLPSLDVFVCFPLYACVIEGLLGRKANPALTTLNGRLFISLTMDAGYLKMKMVCY